MEENKQTLTSPDWILSGDNIPLEYPDYFYEGLAWVGLKQTTLYKNTPDIKDMEKIIEAILPMCSFFW